MEQLNHNDMNEKKSTEFKNYARKRIIVGILLSVVALWVVSTVLGFLDKPSTGMTEKKEQEDKIHISDKEKAHVLDTAKGDEAPYIDLYPKKETGEKHAEPTKPAPKKDIPHKAEEKHKEPSSVPSHDVLAEKSIEAKRKGVAFVRASIEPLDYELHERFWGWRPNDNINLTDNVNNFQFGVLEVTRRTAVALAERLSRTGSTAAFDLHLERAMNWFMVKADRYWFPSPETKYSDGLDEWKTYLKKLEKGEANFYTRSDNLIPLLASYEDLLGSCDENLVKATQDDGSPVSSFKSDDYLYYARGVASAMGTILEAVLEDFHETLESRHGAEILHHAIESCHRASEINPWIVTEGGLSGILANHRANMAAPISHARFYLGLLIKTLST